MCWAGPCNGAVLGPFWIEGSMNQFVYKELLEEKVWPLLKHKVTREEEELCLMQDEAKCHTPLNLEILRSQFAGCGMSNKTVLPWPSISPDLNPLDFFFWGHLMNHMYMYESHIAVYSQWYLSTVQPKIVTPI